MLALNVIGVEVGSPWSIRNISTWLSIDLIRLLYAAETLFEGTECGGPKGPDCSRIQTGKSDVSPLIGEHRPPKTVIGALSAFSPLEQADPTSRLVLDIAIGFLPGSGDRSR